MVAAITSAVKCRVYVDFDFVGAGTGIVQLGGLYANDPAQGQTGVPMDAGMAQTLRMQVGEQILGNGGAITLAEILTALDQVATDFAGASGTPLITAAILAQINGWATGNP